MNVAKLGLTVILTFAILWQPFLSPTQLPQVLHRIFPIARGLFEVSSLFCTENYFSYFILKDKVATFWCAVSPFYKFHLFSIESMVKIR